MSEIVNTEDALTRLCTRLKSEPVVAVDTEFLWERTYYPILGLVQVAVSDQTFWLIDPIALQDISAFGEILSDEKIVKILHDPIQDLKILKRATGAYPRSIYDTRAGAGFAGFSAICSLQAVTQEMLGIYLEKSETRSDWTRRPLSEDQLEYAGDDVIHLPKLREIQFSRCANDDVRAWMCEEFRGLEAPSHYDEADPEDVARVKSKGHLDTPHRNALHELAVWREEVARRHDKPRNFIARDDVLEAIVMAPPDSIDGLRSFRGFPKHLPPSELAEALVAIERGMADTEEPDFGPVLDRKKLKDAGDRVLAVIKKRAEAFHMDSSLVASRKDVSSWLTASDEDRPKQQLVSGWRKAFLGNALDAVAVPADTLR